MHDALRMRGIQSGKQLPGDLSNLALRHPAIPLEPLCHCFALEVLHREKVDFSILGAEGVDVVELADVRMAHLPRISRLRGKAPAVTWEGAFDRHAPIQLLIDGLVDDAHTSVRDLADDAKAPSQYVSRLKGGIQALPGNQRGHQERTH